jgi:DNA-binding MarR family transcriptional regulator
MTTIPRPTRAARTPQALLTEGPVHGIVGYQLAQATIVTSKVFDQVAARQPDDARLRPVEFTLLALVLDNPDVNARQLSRALAITPPNLVGRLEQLQSRGFIERRRSEHDGRAQHIRLTTAGRKLMKRYAAMLVEREQLALAALTAGERAILIELLHKVALSRR